MSRLLQCGPENEALQKKKGKTCILTWDIRVDDDGQTVVYPLFHLLHVLIHVACWNGEHTAPRNAMVGPCI